MQWACITSRAAKPPGAASRSDRLQSSGSRRSRTAGFTFVEMMTIVIIVSVLAMLATYGVRKYILAAKSSEAYNMLTDIRSAEESYRAETFNYLGGTAYDSWHPVTTPGAFKTDWNTNNGVASDNFRTLGVISDSPVYFTYTVVAGPSGAAIPAPPTEHTFSFSPLSQPFYVAVAKGDLDGDGTVFSYFVSTSWVADTYVENEGE